jgi:polysaccharide export outer membrane protein
LPELVPLINSTGTVSGSVLLPGDQLEIQFTENEEWNHETRVRWDGKASFLHLTDLLVAGLTVEQLDEKLTRAYAETIRQYELTVFLREHGGRMVAVLGAVGSPGMFPIPGGRFTMLDALSVAGGVDEAKANFKDILFVRWLPQEERKQAWHIDARPEYWAETELILIQPNDLIYVPMKAIVHVNIWLDQYIRQLIPFPYLYPPLSQ